MDGNVAHAEVTITQLADEQAASPVQIEREIITPAKAEEYLARNTRNRNLSRHTVDTYADDIKNGRWQFTGDPIQFNVNGELINGQHRLSAIIEAGVPVEMMVVRGLPADAITHMDLGRKRTASDILGIEGVRFSALTAAATRSLMALAGMKYSSTHGSPFTRRVSSQEVLEVFRRHPGLQDSAAVCEQIRVCRPSLLTAIHYAASRLIGKVEEADAFVAVFRFGLPAYEGDPAWLLRERMIAASLSNQPMTREHAMRGLVYAWNAFVKGTQFQRLYIPREGFVPMEGLDADLI